MLSAIYEGLRRTHATTLAIVGVVLSIVLWKIAPGTTVEVFWLVPLAVVGIIVIGALLDACRSLSLRKSLPLPKVKAFRSAFPPFDRAAGILLIEPSDLYGFNSEVSVYLDESGFEVPIGVGYVLNIQQNHLIQVLITQVFAENARGKTWEDVQNNNGDALSKLLVRPSKSINLIEATDV